MGSSASHRWLPGRDKHVFQPWRDLSAATIAILIALLPTAAPSARAEVLTYQLLLGSTVQPLSGSWPTGPAEPLTGLFQVQAVSTNYGTVGFRYLSLSFSSPTYLFSLLDSKNALGVGVSPPPFADLNVDVTAHGLSIDSGIIMHYPDPGFFVGPYYRPTELDFPTLRLAPIGGGFWAAQFSITAALIPEPCPHALVSFALLVAFLLRAPRQGRRPHSPALPYNSFRTPHSALRT